MADQKSSVLSLNTQIGLGFAAGILLGLLLMQPGASGSSIGTFLITAADVLGRLFVNALKMILIPLVFLSITCGICNLQSHNQRRKIWKYTFIYFAATTSLAVALGLIMVNIFKPGQGLQQHVFETGLSGTALQQLSLAEFIQNFLTGLFKNPVSAMAGNDVMATVVFALIVGLALIKLGEKTSSIRNLFNDGFVLIMTIVHWVMAFAPWGIAGLITKLVASQSIAILEKLAAFITVVILSLLIHGAVTLPLVLKFTARVSPLFFFKGMRKALVTAFSTSSSSATLPVTMDCVENQLNVDKNIAGFVLPIGATINMDGTTLYEASAAIFIANLCGVDLNLGQQLVVFLMAMIASVGAPGIPSAGMVTMVMVLQSVGLPVEGIAILLPVDRLLDTFRTAVNVEGDSIGCLTVQKFLNK